MTRFIRTCTLSAFLLVTMAASAMAIPTQWSTNGNWYEVIYTPLSWDAANAAAGALSNAYGDDWHLATITSQEEQDFIEGLLGTPLRRTYGYLLGGYQPAGSPEPGGGWTWVTGEAFTYTNWAGGEPNNQQGRENYLYLDDRFNWSWNDYLAAASPAGFYVRGYVVEQEGSASVPEPSALLLLASGLIGLVGLDRRRRR